MLLLALACLGPEAALDASDDQVLNRIVAEESATAFGILAFLNDAGTTLEVLDDEVGLDSRAAASLIHHRNGPDGEFGVGHDDLFDSIDEVDEQYFVGASALDRMVGYCRAHGWVPTNDDIVGVWDGVSFTLDERDLTMHLANKATLGELDDAVGLNARAVDSIRSARPISTLTELSELYYVGGRALEQMKEFAVSREQDRADQ